MSSKRRQKSKASKSYAKAEIEFEPKVNIAFNGGVAGNDNDEAEKGGQIAEKGGANID